MKGLRYRMIYFFGPDGTGKTTHAELVSLYLKRKGYRTWRTSIKQHHTFSYLLLRLINAGKNPSVQAVSYYGFNDELKQRIKTPWKILELVSLLPAIFYRVHLPLLLGYVVICDRYVLDTLVTLSYFLGDRKLILSIFARLLATLIPKNTLLFYMTADTEVILRRKRDEPLTPQLINYYKRAYNVLIRWLGLKTETIDTGTTSVKDAQKIILRSVGFDS